MPVLQEVNGVRETLDVGRPAPPVDDLLNTEVPY